MEKQVEQKREKKRPSYGTIPAICTVLYKFQLKFPAKIENIFQAFVEFQINTTLEKS